MSATTTAVNPTQPAPPPARSANGPASAADDDRFDRHLDAARQQHGEGHDQPAQEDSGQEAATATHAPKTEPGRPKPAQAPAKDQGDTDAAALAAAMLALIGQAAPARPLAGAGMVTHAATAAGTEGKAAKAPAALVLLANTAATAAAARSAIDVDANALAPLLAKPAEQKDASFDVAQLGSLSATPLPAADPGNAVVPTHNLSVASPAGTPAFAQELGQHVVWLGQQDVKQARIRLHPEDLGTLDVKVSMNHDRVDVSFAVQHPAAVHVVQQTLPQLDALLAHHGLALGQADVGQRQQHGGGGHGGDASGAVGEVEAEPAVMASAPAALGMLDTFA
ncbi:MAG TPA: flagellar hook-length control protein FliK [Frateuria sp.]|uniref:flagellar hook-length control protein FliK n=1 Tax=Frateuria sp. TaxID=2211372 RepID=UPI002D7FF215|nr:flagellar hook-length control protein FliK [Frateuria sp.]HET6804622.1 flagellar hook-length control protein FliK [Frateuria sp.]